MNDFLTDQQMASLVEAIQTAEDYSSGEIRIHIDSNTEGNNAEIAFEVFKRLCKDQITTQFSKGNFHDGLKNAVLETGLELKKYFPITGENPNELPNEITFS